MSDEMKPQMKEMMKEVVKEVLEEAQAASSTDILQQSSKKKAGQNQLRRDPNNGSRPSRPKNDGRDLAMSEQACSQDGQQQIRQMAGMHSLRSETSVRTSPECPSAEHQHTSAPECPGISASPSCRRIEVGLA